MSHELGRPARLRLNLRDDVGATAVEYALLVALIAVVILGAVELLGNNLALGFGQVNSSISNGGGGNGGNGGNNNGQGGGWGGGVGGGQGHN